jgi:hypothetical protein
VLGIMPAAVAIETTSEQKRELQRIVTAKTSSQRDVFRPRIILGPGRRTRAIANRLDIGFESQTTPPSRRTSFPVN